MRSVFLVAVVALSGACGETERPVVIEPPDPIELTARVNIQLGDTPAGEQPGYIITGQAVGTRAGREVASEVDSVIVSYRRGGETGWTRQRRSFGVPFSDRLPFEVQAGQTYELRATLYAHARAGGEVVGGSDTWIASGSGY